jgi:hypothetical protein
MWKYVVHVRSHTYTGKASFPGSYVAEKVGSRLPRYKQLGIYKELYYSYSCSQDTPEVSKILTSDFLCNMRAWVDDWLQRDVGGTLEKRKRSKNIQEVSMGIVSIETKLMTTYINRAYQGGICRVNSSSHHLIGCSKSLTRPSLPQPSCSS